MSQPLTLTQFCLLILVIAAVVVVHQIVLTLGQFRRTLSKTDEVLGDLRGTLVELRQIIGIVKARAQALSATLEGFERTAAKLSATLEQVATYILKPFLIISSLLGGVKTALGLFRRSRKEGDEHVRE
ncbi:MAG: hypothetical protein AB1714_23200 [Acidobacteriota bacterium]